MVREPAPCAGGSDAFVGAKDGADVQDRCSGPWPSPSPCSCSSVSPPTPSNHVAWFGCVYTRTPYRGRHHSEHHLVSPSRCCTSKPPRSLPKPRQRRESLRVSERSSHRCLAPWGALVRPSPSRLTGDITLCCPARNDLQGARGVHLKHEITGAALIREGSLL